MENWETCVCFCSSYFPCVYCQGSPRGRVYGSTSAARKKSYLKKSTYKQCEPRQKVNNQDPPQGIFFQQFSEKNRKYTTNFICERFHQSTKPILRCFLKLFIILFRDTVDNCILDFTSRMLYKFS